MTIRNDAMIAARAKLGMSQLEVAAEAGMPIRAYAKLEALDFTIWSVMERVYAIAEVLGITPTDVMPDGTVGQRIESRFVRKSEVAFDMLLEAQQHRLELPSPAEVVEELDQIEFDTGKAIEAIRLLTDISADVLRRRFGLPPYKHQQTLREIGTSIGVGAERVRQIESRALCNLREAMTED